MHRTVLALILLALAAAPAAADVRADVQDSGGQIVLVIDCDDDEDYAVTYSSGTGQVLVNGAPPTGLTDQAADLDGIWAYGGPGSNQIDLSAVSYEDFTNLGTPVIYGLGGDDMLIGGCTADEIYGGPGKDDIQGGPGMDLLLGQDDDDILDGGSGPDLLDGGYGDDMLTGGEDNDFVYGGPGADLLEMSPGTDEYHGDSGNDTFMVDFSGNGEIFDSSGDDHLCCAGASVPAIFDCHEDGTVDVSDIDAFTYCLVSDPVETLEGTPYADVYDSPPPDADDIDAFVLLAGAPSRDIEGDVLNFRTYGFAYTDDGATIQVFDRAPVHYSGFEIVNFDETGAERSSWSRVKALYQ